MKLAGKTVGMQVVWKAVKLVENLAIPVAARWADLWDTSMVVKWVEMQVVWMAVKLVESLAEPLVES